MKKRNKQTLQTRDWIMAVLALVLIVSNVTWYSYTKSQDDVNQFMYNAVREHEKEIRLLQERDSR